MPISEGTERGANQNSSLRFRNVQIFEQFKIIEGKRRAWSPMGECSDRGVSIQKYHCAHDRLEIVHIFVIKKQKSDRNQ
jgi:hypothetical protein